MANTSGPTQRRYAVELRKRAVRMVREDDKETGQSHGVMTRDASASSWASIPGVAGLDESSRR